eukprot:gene7051-1445_t
MCTQCNDCADYITLRDLVQAVSAGSKASAGGVTLTPYNTATLLALRQ